MNVVGLRRRGFSHEMRREIKRAYHLLFQSKLRLEDALARGAQRGFVLAGGEAPGGLHRELRAGRLALMATLGLVAGSGNLPAELAASARRAGWRVAAVGLVGLADPALEAHVDSFAWAHVAEFDRLFEVLRAAGAADVVLAGKVPKTFLWEHRELVRPDARALAAFAALRDRKDDSLLVAVVQVIEDEGLRVRSQLELAPDLLRAGGRARQGAPHARAGAGRRVRLADREGDRRARRRPERGGAGQGGARARGDRGHRRAIERGAAWPSAGAAWWS